MVGYLGDDKATAATLDSNGYLHTGDIATIDANGVVTIVDRMKELIKYKGYQVPPAELGHSCSPIHRLTTWRSSLRAPATVRKSRKPSSFQYQRAPSTPPRCWPSSPTEYLRTRRFGSLSSSNAFRSRRQEKSSEESLQKEILTGAPHPRRRLAAVTVDSVAEDEQLDGNALLPVAFGSIQALKSS